MVTGPTQPNPRVPLYPPNDEARSFVRLMEGVDRSVFQDMRETIHAHVGTPQETHDWTEPERWITEILQGQEQELALHLWRNSDYKVNPRHLTGSWLFSSSYNLLEADQGDILHITPNGEDFIANPTGEQAQLIDYSEGLLNLLMIVAEQGPGKRSDLVPPFGEFMERFSNYRSPNAISSAWYYRIRNLYERGLVERLGVTYHISAIGLTYLENSSDLLQQAGSQVANIGHLHQIWRLVDQQKKEVQEQLRQTLTNIDPYQLELIVKRLLEEMGYENVVVTSRSNDGGVDVVADIEVGITPVREVVQVKRHRKNIPRDTLDKLRGSLHRFSAMRGTIITTGDFASGAKNAAFESNAPPITLIDGDRFISLLIEHGIGIRRESVEVLKFEQTDFIDDATAESV
jgi:restriction system protein